MPLCKICSEIPFLSLPRFPPRLRRVNHYPGSTVTYMHVSGEADDIWLLEQNLGVAHQESFEALFAAAESCELCHLIQLSVSRVIGDCTGENASSGLAQHIGQPVGPLWINRCDWRDSNPLLDCDHAHGFVVLSPVTANEKVAVLVAAFRFCVEQEHSLAGIYPGRPVPADPSDPSVYERLKRWLDTCIHSHGHEEIQDRTLPGRILDVKRYNIEHDEIRLIDVLENETEYIALSHCWGSSQPLKATINTLGTLKTGIPTRSLPKTFQDAIAVTRELGFQYLWIDSLCIIQDDADDWEIEASKMASIYENAVFTIAADRAKDDNEGFLSFRPEREYIRMFDTLDGNTFSVLAFPISVERESDGGFNVQMQNEPLSRRAWALQERLLSMRTFHFGQEQVTFECRSCLLTEDGYNHSNAPGRYAGYSLPDFYRDLFQNGGRCWTVIRNWYSERDLSLPSDKLPALAGLARKFEVLTSSEAKSPEYLAGLWRSSLREDLCWFSFVGSRPVKHYRAPSWSWASVDERVGQWGSGDSYDLAEVEGAHVEVPGHNPYGSVTAGWIKISAPCLPVRPVALEALGDRWTSIIIDIDRTSYSSWMLHWDYDPASYCIEDSCVRRFWFLAIVYNHTREISYETIDARLSGLLLQSLRGDVRNGFSDEVFQRVGYVAFKGECVDEAISMKERQEVRTVTLV